MAGAEPLRPCHAPPVGLPTGFLGQKNLPWRGGYFQELEIQPDRPVTFLQKHPKLGLLAATTDYAPTRMPIFDWTPI
ncbi:MAG: hypothetical protein ACOYOU_21155 [Kiritimatiellia bacterium]